MKKYLLTAALCSLLACLPAGNRALAQDATTGGIPEDAFYLMPDFGQGMVYFSDKGPAQGRLNICALDNTLRFMDDDGQELSAANTDNVTRVVIDGVAFIRDNGYFYRMFPVSLEAGVALKREIRIINDGKKGAYGTVDRTSSIQDLNSIYGTDGVSHDLRGNREFPYQVSEVVFLYAGNDVIPFSKKNLRKLFPQKKEQIDRIFPSGRPAPKTVDEALELLKTLND